MSKNKINFEKWQIDKLQANAKVVEKGRINTKNKKKVCITIIIIIILQCSQNWIQEVSERKEEKAIIIKSFLIFYV